MQLSRISFVLIGLLLLTSSAVAQKVTTDSAPNVNWPSFHTYSWGEGTRAHSPVAGTNLKFASNADSDVFVHSPSGQFYYLAAGRWFHAASLQ